MFAVLVEILQSPSNHHLNDFVGREFRPLQLPDILAIAQDGKPVGQFVNFGHAMADVDDGHSFRTKLPDHLEQSIGFTIRESGRRFIHYQDSAFVEESPGDLHLLLFGHRKMGRALRGLKPGAQPIQHFLGLSIHFGRIFHKPETFQF